MSEISETMDVLSRRDVHLLALLERMVTTSGTAAGPTGTLFDLERIAELLESDAPEIVFQPIVDLATGTAVGYEALSRFSTAPLRSPDLWFAQAARVGLGLELELKAMRLALAALDDIPAGAYLAVNVGAATLGSPAIEALIEGVRGDRVVLELTEHDPIDDYESLGAAVETLRDLGFRLAVDDAGAGCAGFNHILKVSPDIIKLDRGITRSIDLCPSRRDMAASLVALARAVGAVVVAEGVETAAERDELVRIGVTDGQGYLFSEPARRPWDPVPPLPNDERAG